MLRYSSTPSLYGLSRPGDGREHARARVGVVDDLGGVERLLRQDLRVPVRGPALVHDLGHRLRREVVGLVAHDLEHVALPVLERRVLEQERSTSRCGCSGNRLLLLLGLLFALLLLRLEELGGLMNESM